VAADDLYVAEFQQSLAVWEAEVRLKQAKLIARQQHECEVMLQRGSRGRDELEIRRLDEGERLRSRNRNLVQARRGVWNRRVFMEMIPSRM